MDDLDIDIMRCPFVCARASIAQLGSFVPVMSYLLAYFGSQVSFFSRCFFSFPFYREITVRLRIYECGIRLHITSALQSSVNLSD